jgi:hypothetical protein
MLEFTNILFYCSCRSKTGPTFEHEIYKEIEILFGRDYLHHEIFQKLLNISLSSENIFDPENNVAFRSLKFKPYHYKQFYALCRYQTGLNKTDILKELEQIFGYDSGDLHNFELWLDHDYDKRKPLVIPAKTLKIQLNKSNCNSDVRAKKKPNQDDLERELETANQKAFEQQDRIAQLLQKLQQAYDLSDGKIDFEALNAKINSQQIKNIPIDIINSLQTKKFTENDKQAENAVKINSLKLVKKENDVLKSTNEALNEKLIETKLSSDKISKMYKSSVKALNNFQIQAKYVIAKRDEFQMENIQLKQKTLELSAIIDSLKLEVEKLSQENSQIKLDQSMTQESDLRKILDLKMGFHSKLDQERIKNEKLIEKLETLEKNEKLLSDENLLEQTHLKRELQEKKEELANQLETNKDLNTENKELYDKQGQLEDEITSKENEIKRLNKSNSDLCVENSNQKVILENFKADQTKILEQEETIKQLISEKEQLSSDYQAQIKAKLILEKKILEKNNESNENNTQNILNNISDHQLCSDARLIIKSRKEMEAKIKEMQMQKTDLEKIVENLINDMQMLIKSFETNRVSIEKMHNKWIQSANKSLQYHSSNTIENENPSKKLKL